MEKHKHIDAFYRDRAERPRVCSLDLGSDSSSQQTQTTSNTDARLVADSGAVGVSNSSGVTVNATDGGLINAAFDYYKAADAGLTDRTATILASADNTVEALLKAAGDSVASAVNTIDTIKKAQTGEGTFDNSQIMAALIGALALVATMGGGK